MNGMHLLTGRKMGLLAGLPMTALMLYLQRKAGGQRVGKDLTNRAFGGRVADNLARGRRPLSQIGWGAAAGLPYLFLSRGRSMPSVLKGVLYGLAVWAGRSKGWLPGFGSAALAQAGQHGRRGRKGMRLLSHLAWGIGLDLAAAKFRKRRSGPTGLREAPRRSA